jgi:YcxB-like protein
MPITFSLTSDDFGRFQKVVARRFKTKVGLISFQFFLRVFVWLCIGFAVAAYARLMRDFPEAAEPLKTVAASLVVAVAVVVGMPYWAQLALRRHMLDPRGAFLSPQTVQLSASGLHISSATGNTIAPWAGFLALDEDEANYYLFIDAMQAFVLPRKAISGMLAEFEQYTKHLKSAA